MSDTIDDYRVRGFCCRTNLPDFTAYRGFGATQVMFMTETIMNEVRNRPAGVLFCPLLANENQMSLSDDRQARDKNTGNIGYSKNTTTVHERRVRSYAA